MRKPSINIVSESEFTVQGHGVHTAFLEHCAALKARDTYTVFINSKQATDIVHAHTVGPYSWRALHRVPKSRRVITAHIIPDSLTGSLKGGRLLHASSRQYLRWFYSQAGLIIAVSQEVADALKLLGIKNRIEVIPNGINLHTLKPNPKTRQRLRHKLSLPDKRIAVIGNGQIQPRKRFDTFCKTAHSSPDKSFIWIGGMPFGRMGSQYQKMTRLVDTAPANIIITGLLDRSAALEHMQAGDVFFLPSEQENHPLAVLEAAALRLPIILRDIPEYRTSFPEGALYGDEKTFTQLIKQCSTPNGHRAAAQAAYRIAQRYDITKLTTQLEALYTDINQPLS